MLHRPHRTLSTDRANHRTIRHRPVGHASNHARKVVSHCSDPVQADRSCNRRDCFSAVATGVAWGLLSPLAKAEIVDEDVAVNVYSQATLSTVSVVVYKVVGGNDILQGVGSGIVWDSYGHVVTNYHCVAQTDKKSTQAIKIAYQPRGGPSRSVDTVIVAMDPLRDLAVLLPQQPLEGVLPIRVGQSGTLKVGQSVFALGYPYGLSQSLSSGVVSGLDRAIPSPVGTKIYGAIQTDADINQGNSGGPLLDSFGRLVGLNTATFTRSGTGRGSGVNFALPVDLLVDVVPKMVVYGNASGRRV